MPTENRSSNTEMVSVPRELTESIVRMLQGSGGWKTAEQLSAILAQPAEQHQGEPVAYQKPEDYWSGFGHVDRSCHIELRKMVDHLERLLDEVPEGPLYTHADPGEVERLRENHRKHAARLIDERGRLRAQLAERDALLRKALASCDEATAAFEDDPNGPGQWTCHACFAYTNAQWHHGGIVSGGPNEIAHELDCWAEQARKLLSASAEPSACEHDWIDARNQFVQSGGLCIKCHAIRAGNVTLERKPS